MRNVFWSAESENLPQRRALWSAESEALPQCGALWFAESEANNDDKISISPTFILNSDYEPVDKLYVILLVWWISI